MMFTEELHWIKDVRVLVFKTNAPLIIDTKAVADLFDNVEGIQDWNFDLEDCDRIFRMVTDGIDSGWVISMLKKINIKAIELND